MRAFEKLNKSKQETIINAAIKEFAEKDYNSASTNSIIKDADISKGALFFYFKSKEALYLYVLEYCLNFRSKMIFDKCIDLNEKDAFNRLLKYMGIQLKIDLEYPYIRNLIYRALYKERPTCALSLIESNQKVFMDIYKYLAEGIDTSYLRDDISFEYIVKIVTYTLDGYHLNNESEMTLKTIDYEKIFKEFEELAKVFKKLFYKTS